MNRILVVDDEPELLQVLREHFEGRYEVETALSGASAIERFVRQRPDMVFLDINMPGGNGLAVLKLLRQADPKIPVVIVTANAENAVAAECITEGAFGYVPKPFNLTYMDHMAAVAIEQAGRPRR
jgi:CheY-like chemotaxis protein